MRRRPGQLPYQLGTRYGSSLIMSLDEGCAGQAGAEPQTWETSRGRG